MEQSNAQKYSWGTRLKLNIAYCIMIFLLAVLSRYFGLDYFVPVKIILIVLFPTVFVATNLFPGYFDKYKVNLLLIFFACTITTIASDLILRATISSNFYYRPHEMFSHKMPEYPGLLSRYDQNIEYKGETYGDLTAMSGEKENAQLRKIRFSTDSLGFRNNPGQKDKKNQIIVIGDSFGVGSGTDQDSTCVGFLSKNSSVYNLSFPGTPMDELANLVIEYEKINHTKNPTVIWLLFTGNDIPNWINPDSDKYLDLIASSKLGKYKESNGAMLLITKLKTYLNRSPIRQLMQRLSTNNSVQTIAKDFSGGKMYFYKLYQKTSNFTQENIVNQSMYSSFKRIFYLANEFSKGKSIDLKVVLIPTKYEVYKWVNDETEAWEIKPEPSGFT